MYLNNKECVDKCPDDKKFFIASETDENKKCMTDCPLEYPFYKNEDGLYKCYSLCDKNYITNRDPKINAKECIPQCNDLYPFSFQHNSTHTECYEVCPKEASYYDDSDKKCNSKCPTAKPYHEKNSDLCLEECPSKIVNYATNECMTDCEVNQFYLMKSPNKFCLNNCNETDSEHFYTPQRECVSSCDSTKFFRANNNNNECVCQGLFYFDSNWVKICVDPSIQSCENINIDGNNNYKIQLNGTSQCLSTCFGVLSPDETVCYDGSNETVKCPNNTKSGFIDGKIKCDCEYNYYFDANNKKICLGKDEGCPNGLFLIPDLKKCVQQCDSEYPNSLDNMCYKNCPSGFDLDESNKKCKCSNKWYKLSENKIICLLRDEPCVTDFPYLVEETNECVKDCATTRFPILSNNKCISGCSGNYKQDTDIKGNLKCICKYLWYYDEKNKVDKCEENSYNNCTELSADKNLNLHYEIKKIKQCVSSCPEDYNYFFNKNCYSSCAEDNLINITNSFECQCKGKWKIIDDQKVCSESETESCDEGQYYVESTKQCISNISCPYDSPYLFESVCYKECPREKNLIEDPIKGNACRCQHKWYKNNDNKIICLNEIDKCQDEYFQYYLKSEKQCVRNENECKSKYIFNYTCYERCPLNTTEKIETTSEEGTDNPILCECDIKKGKWYKYKDDFNREMHVCGLDECPDDRYLNKNNSECVINCGENYLYLNVCYTQCPALTEPVEEEKICKLSVETTEGNLTTLIKDIQTDIVNIYNNLPDGGLVINNNNDATMQIYGLKKNKANADSIIRTNLANIDLSGCIDKIYQSNQLDSKDDIIVVQLDIKSKNKKLVINPIEYEFRDSKNGRVLDASVCEKNEVVISYPITYMLKNKNKKKTRALEDDDDGEIDEQEIMDKFSRGKILNEEDNSIDSFNYNSTIYSNICYPIEINGKDLILENRISYFYPNYSFCESMCTYDYTDFAGERIYCNCTIKSGIEIDRPHNVKIVEYNKNETDNNQIGPTNIPVLKCISLAKIKGNGAFYFCIIFIIVEFALLLIFIFQGKSALTDKIRDKAFNGEIYNGKSSDEDEKINKIKVNNNVYKYTSTNGNLNEKNAKTSERDLDAPPKKDKYNNNSEEKQNNKKDVIKIKTSKNKKKSKEFEKIIDEKNNFDIFSGSDNNNENEKNNNNEIKSNDINSNDNNNYNKIELKKYLQKNEIEAEMGFLHSMKKEEKLLRENYSTSIVKDKFDSIIVVLTSIFDKIYLTKILLLSGKYEIVSIMFSLYLLCHLLLLTFSGFFFDIKTIKKIWEEEDYPNLGYYLLYGFISNLIVWIIFKMFNCLLDNESMIKKYILDGNNFGRKKIEKRYKKLMDGIKRNTIIYLCIQFALIMFCSFYLITFCGIYTGTKDKIFTAYGIAFIEIVIIKIIYGAVLGVLRKVSLCNENKIMYNVVLILNKFIS